ncbi:MAG: hybrid sensor histidine kinase/response regulator [Myxococcales bacterium]|nr:hybrid sensor histidine kinase/response regulator [Myxococcales bacterium]
MPRTILYVDDEPDLQPLIESKFADEIAAKTLNCEFVSDGGKALERVDARTTPYEVIFIDISMPGMSGLELLDGLVARDVESPIVILSAHSKMDNIRRAMNHGAFDFLTKPIDLDDLAVTLEKARRRFEANRRARVIERAYGRPELAALGLNVAGVAHDLKNPLGFMLNFTALAVDLLDELGEELRERCPGDLVDDVVDQLDSVKQTLGKVQNHGNNALDLVASLLTTGARTRLDFNNTIETYVDLFVSSLRASNPDFELRIEKRFDPATGQLELQRARLVSVVVNLLENAFHALRERVRAGERFEAVITVETHGSDDAVELCISDNGPGIPVDLREQIFQPFFTTKQPGEGTGLGLHLIDKIVREEGGTVTAEDNPPQGAKLRVRLPRPAT